MPKLFSYVVDHDHGFAPNPSGRLCTLAKCKYGTKKRNIVEPAEVGDWIAGTGGSDLEKSAGHGKLIYAMRVDDKIPLAEYCRAYNGKRDDADHDIVEAGRYALLSRHFFYFGRNAIDLTEIPRQHLDRDFEKKGPRHRSVFPEEFVKDFATWLESNFSTGVHGPPCQPLPEYPKPRCSLQVRRKKTPSVRRQVVLLRVGIDSGSGGIQGPLFRDGSFEFVSIPDNKQVSVHKYGTFVGRNGLPHSEYFPERRRQKGAEQHIHLDPEFETFTYGDPTTPKRSLRKLKTGDYLIFYCGLQEWDKDSGWSRRQNPALYIAGYFEIEMAGMANDFSQETLKAEFGKNFHVRYPSVFRVQRDDLVVVKGGSGSRLLEKAYKISSVGTDKSGKPLKVLSPKMQKVFGDFGGHVSIQRSPPRWVDPAFVEKAIKFVAGLR